MRKLILNPSAIANLRHRAPLAWLGTLTLAVGLAGCPNTNSGDSQQNAPGAEGPAGPVGATGATGAPGEACWDLNGNGVGDPGEDVNGDGKFDALDCQGSLPSGTLVLGNSPTPPSGFTFTGMTFDTGDEWNSRASSPVARAASGVCDLNGLYVVGGLDPNVSGPITDASRYDPATNTWTSMPPMPTARYLPAIGVINGKVIVAGGSDSNDPVDTVEIFDSATNLWSPGAALPVPVYAAVSAVANGKLYVIGGLDATSTVLPNVQIYNPATNSWGPGTAMPTPRAAGYGGVINGAIIVAGGTDNTVVYDKVESYNVASNTWTTLGNMPRGLALGAGAVQNNRLYVIGGIEASSSQLVLSDTTFEFDPSDSSWTSRAAPNGEPIYASAAGVAGKILMVGGVNLSTSTPTQNLEEYTPATTVFVYQKN